MEKSNTKQFSLSESLIAIQSELKVPKGNYNSFGKYKYRSAEDILEAVKPLLKKYNVVLTMTDDIVPIGNKLFLKATANLANQTTQLEIFGFAEMGEHKGMSSEQCTGTASSYARKYALNGLFLIDETESDPDHENKKTETKEQPKKDLPELPQSKAADVEKFLKEGGTIEQVQKKYKLNEAQIFFFEQIIKNK
jgi:hypothetical protein